MANRVTQRIKAAIFRSEGEKVMVAKLYTSYVERIAADPHGLLPAVTAADSPEVCCPGCGSAFGRPRMIHGRLALKLVGGKTRATK